MRPVPYRDNQFKRTRCREISLTQMARTGHQVLRMRAVNAIEVERARGSVSPDATFEAVYREHFEFAWASLRHLGVPESQVDDAVQELFIVVHRRLPEFDWDASVRTWMFAIAKRVAARQRRTTSRAVRKKAAVAKETPHIDPDLLDDAVARTQAGEILFEFLDSLDDDKREVFILAHLEGLRGPEIAEVIGIPVNTVYSRLRVAKERFDTRCQRLHAHEAHILADARTQPNARPCAASAQVPSGHKLARARAGAGHSFQERPASDTPCAQRASP